MMGCTVNLSAAFPVSRGNIRYNTIKFRVLVSHELTLAEREQKGYCNITVFDTKWTVNEGRRPSNGLNL